MTGSGTGGRERGVRQLPAVVVLAVAAAGLVLGAAGAWRAGAVVFGVALLLGGGLRLSLPARRAGWLVVRTRVLDAAVLLGLGFAVVVLAGTHPPA